MLLHWTLSRDIWACLRCTQSITMQWQQRHKHIYQINSSAQVHLMHSQYVRAFWTLFAFSWSFIYPHDISNLYVLSFQVSFLNKYCKFFIHSWLSFAFVFIRFFLSEDVAPHDILQLQLPFNFSSPCQKQSNYLIRC